MTSVQNFARNLRDSLTGFSGRRVFALMLRYWYLLRSSWPRILELIYWPLVQMITWGFLQSYIQQNANPVTFVAGTLIGAMLLWDVLFRSQLGYSVSFLEEMWSRNLGNLFMSPLRPLEFMAAMMLMSLVRLVIGLAPVSLLAILFFGFNVFSLGFAAIGFFVNLVLTGWAVGIAVSGLVLRNGLGAEGLAWTVMFVLLPLSCVYYPVSVLPEWLQPLAWALPPTSIFEGLRALLIEQVVRTDLLLQALAMNAVLIMAAIALFLWLVEDSRKSGSLLQMGE